MGFFKSLSVRSSWDDAFFLFVANIRLVSHFGRVCNGICCLLLHKFSGLNSLCFSATTYYFHVHLAGYDNDDPQVFWRNLYLLYGLRCYAGVGRSVIWILSGSFSRFI